jgi:hypothetical protein
MCPCEADRQRVILRPETNLQNLGSLEQIGGSAEILHFVHLQDDTRV